MKQKLIKGPDIERYPNDVEIQASCACLNKPLRDDRDEI
jgi:hypothetical protein